MKNSKIINHISSLVLLIILASGCLEYTITTRIMPDGSIERTVLVEGDSSSIFKGSLPVPTDSSWEIVAGYQEKSAGDSIDEKKYVYKARKVFRNSGELNQELNWDTAGEGQIIRQVKVEKRFRWFHTYYRYSETYRQLFPFTRKPVNDFLSDEELELAHAGDDEIYYSPASDRLLLKKDTLVKPALSEKDSLRMDELKKSLETKYFEWIKANLYEEYFDALKVALEKSGIMKPDETERTRDSLYVFFDANYDFESFWTTDSSDVLLQLASAYYHIDTAVIHQSNRSDFDVLYSKLQNMLPGYDDSFTNLTIMPGLIISTNSTELNGNTVSWAVDSENFFEKDYTLLVESRKVNKGPIIVSGAVIALLLIGLVVGMVRKK